MVSALSRACLTGAVVFTAQLACAISFQGLDASFDNGYNQSELTAISGDGNVVIGTVALPTEPESTAAPSRGSFSWDWTDATYNPVNNFNATSICYSGETWAGSYTNREFPAIWTEAGGVDRIGQPSGQFIGTDKLIISGDTHTLIANLNMRFGSVTKLVSYLWTEDNGYSQIAPLPLLGHDTTLLTGISQDGSAIVGTSMDLVDAGELINLPNRAFLWTSTGGILNLGALPHLLELELVSHSAATGISADGQVVIGYSVSYVSEFEGFIWDQTNGMQSLGYIAGEPTPFSSIPNATTANGSVVVGNLQWTEGDEEDTTPYIWDTVNGMQDMKAYLEGYGLDLDGWTLKDAVDISADGTVIIGNGINPDGNSEGWVASLHELTSEEFSEPIPDFSDGIGLCIASQRGVTYLIESTTDLSLPFTPEPGGIVVGNGKKLLWTDQGLPADQKYYRISAE